MLWEVAKNENKLSREKVSLGENAKGKVPLWEKPNGREKDKVPSREKPKHKEKHK
jgi:hypothetical protein